MTKPKPKRKRPSYNEQRVTLLCTRVGEVLDDTARLKEDAKSGATAVSKLADELACLTQQFETMDGRTTELVAAYNRDFAARQLNTLKLLELFNELAAQLRQNTERLLLMVPLLPGDATPIIQDGKLLGYFRPSNEWSFKPFDWSIVPR